MNRILLVLVLFFLASCGDKKKGINPQKQDITESVYASGTIKSKNQYQVFSKVNGLIDQIYVDEGDSVYAGSPILSIESRTAQLNSENAKLSARFYDFGSNAERLDEARKQIQTAKLRMNGDSTSFERQKKLKEKGLGADADYDFAELSYSNSKIAYSTAKLSYKNLKKQLAFNSDQAKKNQKIADVMSDEYTVFSELNGTVYSINKVVGEMVSVQTPLAVIGEAGNFILEMQIDEDDILKIKVGQKVVVSMDSYEGRTFNATVTKVRPMMDKRSKTFYLEALFDKQPAVLYPNMNFEANIIIETKKDVLLIPREYLQGDSLATLANGDQVAVQTGLKDYKMIEIVSGITEKDEIIIPD